MGRPQKYPVHLSETERIELQSLVRTGEHPARIIRRAQILLWSAEGKEDKEIAALTGCALMTIASTRERWMSDKRLEDLPRPGGTPKLDAKQESLLVALACSDAPEGRATWTMQLLADKLIELNVIDSISDEAVRRTLKKTSLSPGKSSSGASPK
jgi:transposase